MRPKRMALRRSQWAAYRDDLELADLLIAAGANPKIPNREGATAMQLASLAWQRCDDGEAPQCWGRGQ